MGKKVIALDISEGVCLGTAILAGTAIGKYSSIEEAVNLLVKPKEVYYPRDEIAQEYDEKLKVYEQIYPALNNINLQI